MNSGADDAHPQATVHFLIVRPLCALLALAMLLCAPGLAADRSHLSRDPQVNQARALIQDGRHHAALELLRPLADPARDDLTDIRFLIGLAAMAAAGRTPDKAHKTALLNEAIAALRAILINRPELTRVRLELARAFFLKGDDGLARRHFERVLGGNPPPAMAVNIRRFLHAIRARHKWSGYFALSLEQNDNINRASDTEIIYLFGLPFVLNEESRPHSGTGLALFAGGEYQYPLAERWRWRFGADLSRLEHEGHEFDEDSARVRSGPRWLASRRSEVGLQAVAGRRWRAGDRYRRERGLLLTARHRLTPKFGLNGRVSGEKIRYRGAPASDATEVRYDLDGTYLFSPLVQGSAGLGRSRERLERGGVNRRRAVRVGLSVIVGNGWTVGANLQWSRRRFASNAMFSSERRVDRERTARLFLLNRRLTFFGLSPQLVVTRERGKSNSALNDYRRTRTALRLVRQF